MKALLAILLMIITARSSPVSLVWDYDDNPRFLAFEIDMRIDGRPSRPLGEWYPAGTAFDNGFTTDLPDGIYHARVRAMEVSGLVSKWSNICPFAIPKPPPPVPATHCRVIVRDSAGAVISETLDPIGTDATFFKMSADGTRVLRSTDLMAWQSFGPPLPAGNYDIETNLLTILP